MTLADEIRKFVYEKYIRPACERGKKRITIRAGDVHREMGLVSRMPAVCSALGARKFESMYDVKLVRREGPTQGANVYFTFELRCKKVKQALTKDIISVQQIPWFLEESLQVLSKDYAGGDFIPLLEADVVGYLYHILVSKLGSAAKIHIDTRICIDPNKKFDLVIGRVSSRVERPCIEKPELIIEVKFFSSGFTDQQCRIRYLHVIEDDIPKLTNVKEPLDNRYILLFDEENYLQGRDTISGVSRINRIVRVRDERDPRIKIIHVKKVMGGLKWILL